MQTVMENVALRSVIIVLIALSCWYLADLIGEILIQRKKSLHVRFFISCAKGILVVLTILVFGMQFSITRELTLTLFQSASLMVAVIGLLSGKLNDAPSGRLFRADLEFLQRCPSL